LRVLSEFGDDADGTTKPALGRVGEKDGIRAGGECGIRVDTYGFIYPSASNYNRYKWDRLTPLLDAASKASAPGPT
jgi:hypothetical protein